MNNLIKTGINETITSLELCNQINVFRNQLEGKSELAHADLLKVIRDEFEEELGEGKISLSSYKTSQNKDATMYKLTLSQAKQVLVRESKHVRKAVIQYIEQLENQSNKPAVPQTYLEALECLVAVEKENLALSQTVQEQAPKVEYYDKVLDSKILYSTTVIAKEFGMSATSLNRILKQHGIIYKQGNLYVPYKDYQHLIPEYCNFATSQDGYMSLKWTQKGRNFIHQIINGLLDDLSSKFPVEEDAHD